MADKLRITTQTLQRDAESIRKSIETIKNAVNRMQDEGAQLHTMWAGPSHDAFKAQFDSDIVAALALIKDLETFVSGLDKAAGEYKECSEKVDSIIAEIKL